jgi:hypothetical protein
VDTAPQQHLGHFVVFAEGEGPRHHDPVAREVPLVGRVAAADHRGAVHAVEAGVALRSFEKCDEVLGRGAIEGERAALQWVARVGRADRVHGRAGVVEELDPRDAAHRVGFRFEGGDVPGDELG